MSKVFHYFAYGSNMYMQRLGDRCPGAEMLFVAELKGYEFQMTQRRLNGYGAADIVAKPGERVLGIVYMIPVEQKDTLRKAEGCPGAYVEEDIKVMNLITSQTVDVITYTVRKKKSPPVETTLGYREFVLRGAREWNLPEDYIEELSSKMPVVIGGMNSV